MVRRFIRVIFIISILIGCLLGYYFLNKYYLFSIPCLFHQITNLYCPGCGITRCMFSLLEGNVGKAFQYNGLVAIMLFPFSIYILINIYRYIKGDDFIELPNRWWNILLIVVIIFGIIRNIY